jgi:hypothetical protein
MRKFLINGAEGAEFLREGVQVVAGLGRLREVGCEVEL